MTTEMVRLFKPFVDVDAAMVEVEEVLRSGILTAGPRVAKLERAFATFLGFGAEFREVPLMVNSCTSAIDLALHLCGLRGREVQHMNVVSTAMTCTATNTNVVTRGAKIKWADVDPDTGNINIDDAVRLVDDRTKAVIVVDWGGFPVDVPMLKRLLRAAGREGVPVIRDAAHSLGVGPVALYSDYVCWSFQAIKHLTTGDGGALLVPKEQWERARLLRWYGLDRDSASSFRDGSQNIDQSGYKYNMNDLDAAIGLANLPHMGRILRAHQTNAMYLTHRLFGLFGVRIPTVEYIERSANWLYTIQLDDRDGFIQFAASCGVEASPVHARNDRHAAFRDATVGGQQVPRKPGLDWFAAHEVAIPVGWWLSPAELDRVATTVIRWVTMQTEAAGATA